MSTQTTDTGRTDSGTDFDAVVVGAGFSGLRMLIELRRLGLSAVAVEAGTDVGGTWYWNRYPGARTDSESWSYCFSSFPELLEEWTWKERYPKQQEVLDYQRFVADKFDLRKNIRFSTRVESASYDARSNTWSVRTDTGDTLRCTYFITGLGHLSVPHKPQFAGIDSFAGEVYVTGNWPKEPVDFAGKRVGVIGAGASAVQAIPVIAEEAAHLTVFQRTPNFVVPAQNHPLSEEQVAQIKADYPAIWQKAQSHVFGFPMSPAGRVYDDVTDEEREQVFEQGWRDGGFHYVFETFDDILIDQRSNDAASEFIRGKIRETVKDPVTAELLCPKGYPYVAKRPPAGHGYYETYNRDDVTLVDVLSDPIAEIVPGGVRTASGAEHQVDVLVFATGFDAVTGALEKIDIAGVDGRRLTDEWREGPQTYLGISNPGFPNLLFICGPQSAYANIPVVVEKVVWTLGQALERMGEQGLDRIEATPEAAAAWKAHLDEVLHMTLIPQGEKVGSWYLGANIPGKPRSPLFYFGGAGAYAQWLDGVVAKDFDGFVLSSSAEPAQVG
ncbi:NAD(P)/FAD-dependent oxidoreductase [Pseudonocardia sp. KRD-184]|uniref:NAD(P)/FAD-dependent oxidoreductase n=1 Tax=Pseudonocardia oceani TaxID=2792013 RepID=A0ABS6U378_9PSEU|nr:NAD(P)/FAD-dependent oxidoreductase [Pseudonocardia oceani]MBW0089051.1 NAD(P)/FAD-dependent oxidoreductase [Pseudonocardia oceani]MBW0094684.1 NAD(P)/FAD-dependent oxidoreductase [Pseudonocardia oceani]MBW0119794.1 NAD(P)/FAD-dependent oxidoreductase [Pseudonocardia oceani]MBW0126690.1 NAD(P)/FAD-dependent oxidoreductase [Pseudonocardia oceani]